MNASALGELEAGARLAVAVFLALDHPRIAGQEALLLERRAKLGLVMGQRLGKAVAHRARLSREAAAAHRHRQVILRDAVHHHEGLAQDHAQDGSREILVERLAVDGGEAPARLDPDARDRVLAFSRSVGAPILVELLNMDRRFGGRLGRESRALEVGERGQSLSHSFQRSGCSWGSSWRRRAESAIARRAGGPGLYRRAGCQAASCRVARAEASARPPSRRSARGTYPRGSTWPNAP